MGSNHACLTIISLVSALKEDENYYYRVVWKENSQNKWKEKKRLLFILLRDIESFYSDSDEEQIETIYQTLFLINT